MRIPDSTLVEEGFVEDERSFQRSVVRVNDSQQKSQTSHFTVMTELI
jgi:hypothetical protein